MPLPTSERIAKAKQQAEQAKARLQALQARLGEAERKKDTRRKIILGGLLLDAAGKDERFARVLTTLLGRVERDNDRRAFEGWDAPSGVTLPPSAPASPPPTADGQGSSSGNSGG